MKYFKRGSSEPYQTRTYILKNLETKQTGALTWKWKEGAIIKDENTMKKYVVRNGQLVIDPRLLKVPGPTPWRRLLFIGCLVGIIGWVLLRVRSKYAGSKAESF
ncbi:MAG: hypothetical protein IT203_08015 [Fimbriimonadaceae bacterium]|nr:hypothetical protein [Fimbriimonadaceae bacterium]